MAGLVAGLASNMSAGPGAASVSSDAVTKASAGGMASSGGAVSDLMNQGVNGESASAGTGITNLLRSAQSTSDFMNKNGIKAGSDQTPMFDISDFMKFMQ